MSDRVRGTHVQQAAVRPYAQPATTVEATAPVPGPGLPTTLEGVLKSIRDVGTDTAMATVMDRWKIGAQVKLSRSLGIQDPAEIIASRTGLTLKQLHHCERINQVFELQALERFVRQGMRAQTVTELASEALDSAREFLLELFAAGRLSDPEVHAHVVELRKASADDGASTHRTPRTGGLRFEIGIQAVPGNTRFELADQSKLGELVDLIAGRLIPVVDAYVQLRQDVRWELAKLLLEEWLFGGAPGAQRLSEEPNPENAGRAFCQWVRRRTRTVFLDSGRRLRRHTWDLWRCGLSRAWRDASGTSHSVVITTNAAVAADLWGDLRCRIGSAPGGRGLDAIEADPNGMFGVAVAFVGVGVALAARMDIHLDDRQRRALLLHGCVPRFPSPTPEQAALQCACGDHTRARCQLMGMLASFRRADGTLDQDRLNATIGTVMRCLPRG